MHSFRSFVSFAVLSVAVSLGCGGTFAPENGEAGQAAISAEALVSSDGGLRAHPNSCTPDPGRQFCYCTKQNGHYVSYSKACQYNGNCQWVCTGTCTRDTKLAPECF